jgi:hypothetical protein
MLVKLVYQALILAALQNKSEQKMRDYYVISFESQLDLIELQFD